MAMTPIQQSKQPRSAPPSCNIKLTWLWRPSLQWDLRDIFLYQANPSPAILFSCVFWAALAMIVGYLVFHKSEHKFILFI